MTEGRAPSISFTTATLLLLRSPLVYVFRRGADVMYVGKGACASRPLDRNHHALGDLGADQNDSLELHVCESEAAALKLEAALILELRPVRNVVRGRGSRVGGDPSQERLRARGAALQLARNCLRQADNIRDEWDLERRELEIPEGLAVIRVRTKEVKVETVRVERVVERVPLRILTMPRAANWFAGGGAPRQTPSERVDEAE